jgi:hypothetical protein
MENLDDLDLPVRINFTFENDKYIKRDGVVYFNPIIFTTITSAVEVGKPERRYPIHYYYPYEIIEDIEILIPSSWKIKNLPSEITLNYPWVTYERKVSINGNNIKIKKTFRLERIEISLEEYKDYKEAIEKIIKLEQEMIMAER